MKYSPDDKTGNKYNLSAIENRSIVTFLCSHIPQIRQLFGLLENETDNKILYRNVEELVRRSHLMYFAKEMHMDVNEDWKQVNFDDVYLYKRGKITNACTLILSGRLKVLSGKEKFEIEMGPWSILAVDALIEQEGKTLLSFKFLRGTVY